MKKTTEQKYFNGGKGNNETKSLLQFVGIILLKPLTHCTVATNDFITPHSDATALTVAI